MNGLDRLRTRGLSRSDIRIESTLRPAPRKHEPVSENKRHDQVEKERQRMRSSLVQRREEEASELEETRWLALGRFWKAPVRSEEQKY